MKKHLSLLMLATRSIVYKLLLVLLALAAADIALFALTKDSGNRIFFELIDSSGFYYAYIFACALVQIILLGVCTSGSAKPRYTLARLSVSEKGVMYWHWLCGSLCFLILWAWQVLILHALGKWHLSYASSDVVSHQSLYLSAFRSYFIHSLLPFEDVSRLVRNLIEALCLGGMAAAAAFKLRRGKKAGFGPALAIALLAGTFRAEAFEPSYDGFLIFAFLFILLISMVGVYTGDAEVDYEEASLES